MSDANRTAVRAVKETSFRTAPATPFYQEIRFNSENLAYAPTTEVSNELDSTRQIKDLILTGFEVSGDLTTEYSLENLDILLEGAFCNTWTRTPEVYNGAGWEYGASATRISNLTFATGANTFTTTATSVLNGSAANSATTAFVAGMLVRVTGCSNAANNGLFPVASSTATTVVLTNAAGVAETPPATARLKVVGVQGASGDITAVTAGGNALVTTTLNWTTMGLIVGQWVKVSSEGGNFSFATAGANTYARISAITATRLSFDMVVGTWAADTGTSKTIRVYFGDTIRTGTSNLSYRLEKNYVLDAGVRYAYFRGCEVNTLAISGDTRAIVTATVSFMGSDSTGVSASRDGSATTIPSATGAVLDSSNSVPWLLEGGSTVTTPNYVSSFSFQMENNLRAQAAVGQPGAIGMGQGRANFTGNLNTYFGDETLYSKLINNTASSVAFSFRDSTTSKAEIWDVPRLKYSSGVPEVTGIDTDLFVNLSFQALRDVVNNRDYTVMLNRFDYAA